MRRRAFLSAAASSMAALIGRSDWLIAIAADLTFGPPAQMPATSVQESGDVQLDYVPGSNVKIEQIIGDFDKQLQQPTVNQTESRYGIIGTDLGSSFEHQGKLYFLFGDTLGPGARDPMGYSQSTDPEGPLLLDFLSRGRGTFVAVKPPDLPMGPFDVPIHGLSLEGTPWVVVKSNHSDGASTDRSYLTRFDERALTFATVREISRLPGGHFIKMTLRVAPPGLAALPSQGPTVLMFGSGEYRSSNAYLAAIPAATFASGDGTQYFAGMNGSDPMWADREDAAAPIVMHPTIGDLSVIYLDQLGLWIMTYDSRDPRGILLRYASTPWGPWSDPIIIFNEIRDGALGTFIHDPRRSPDDGIAGPVAGRQPATQVPGGGYAPYIIERFTGIQDQTLTLHYLLSTWNPYTVVRLRSTLSITTAS